MKTKKSYVVKNCYGQWELHAYIPETGNFHISNFSDRETAYEYLRLDKQVSR